MLFSLLFRSRSTLFAAGFAFFIFGSLATNILNINLDIATPAAAAPTTMNFTKITYDTRLSGEDAKLVAGSANIGPPTSQPFFVLSNGLNNNPNPTNGFATTRRLVISNLGSSGQDGVTVNFTDAPSPPNTGPLGPVSYFDIFNNISLPDTSANATQRPTTMRSPIFHNLGSSGQDGVSIDLLLIDPNGGEDIPVNITCTIPAGQGVSFASITPEFNPLATPNIDPSQPTFSSFFDIFTELDVTGPLDSSQPLFQLTTTLNTPEPASLSLLALSLPLLLKRRK